MTYSGLKKHAVISFIILFSFPVFASGADIMNLFSSASGSIKLGPQESEIVMKSRHLFRLIDSLTGNFVACYILKVIENPFVRFITQ